MAQIFTFGKLDRGRMFQFYSVDVVLKIDDEIEIWHEKSNKGLGDPIIYGKARVIACPNNPYHLYGAVVLGENCN